MAQSADTATDGDPYYRETTERFWLFRLVTEVRDDGVYVRLAPIHQSFRRISPTDIDAVTATTYASERYGGWHWGLRRSPGGKTVYRLRGNRGVELHLTDDTYLFIGSEAPAELADTIHHTLDVA